MLLWSSCFGNRKILQKELQTVSIWLVMNITFNKHYCSGYKHFTLIDEKTSIPLSVRGAYIATTAPYLNIWCLQYVPLIQRRQRNRHTIIYPAIIRSWSTGNSIPYRWVSIRQKCTVHGTICSGYNICTLMFIWNRRQSHLFVLFLQLTMATNCGWAPIFGNDKAWCSVTSQQIKRMTVEPSNYKILQLTVSRSWTHKFQIMVSMAKLHIQWPKCPWCLFGIITHYLFYFCSLQWLELNCGWAPIIFWNEKALVLETSQQRKLRMTVDQIKDISPSHHHEENP